ncbi:MAG: hypothetical protein OIF47_04370 [Marinibacterium sp.]|nr:hypothetical protein [Marinibacterium sp.]
MTTPPKAPIRRLDAYGFDGTERALLPVLRNLLTSFDQPDSQAWLIAQRIAVEALGETRGLMAAHLAGKLVASLHETASDPLHFHDPLCPDQRELLTEDELALMRMLHHMRRDNVPAARDAVDRLGRGRHDPHVIRAALTLANRLPRDDAPKAPPKAPARGRPVLRVVS